ncbi:60S ribosomal protein L36-3-like [Iris pallida]|uniref:60S ribosomal protein L36-3-like n=1 Tax=Iris pallida TaxID=29817 RepID=A0AAX6FVR4_IRIPA|nr:60S ribosomal protein L36-3-like [Iris pallida]
MIKLILQNATTLGRVEGLRSGDRIFVLVTITIYILLCFFNLCACHSGNGLF